MGNNLAFEFPSPFQHGHLEKRLHWVKDVVLQEELAPLCDGPAPVNFALVRTMALNLFRHHGLDSITQGLRRLAHDIPTLFSFFNRSALPPLKGESFLIFGLAYWISSATRATSESPMDAGFSEKLVGWIYFFYPVKFLLLESAQRSYEIPTD